MWKLELPCEFYFQRRLKVKSRSVLVSTRPDFPSRLNSLNLLPLICRVNQKTPGQGPLCPPTINFMAIFISSRREVSSISGGGDARTAHSESETQKPQNQVCSYNRFLQKKEAGHSCGMKAERRGSRRGSEKMQRRTQTRCLTEGGDPDSGSQEKSSGERLCERNVSREGNGAAGICLGQSLIQFKTTRFRPGLDLVLISF